MDYKDNIDKRRNYEGFIQETLDDGIIFKRMALKKQAEKKKRIRLANTEYNFLQYSYIIKAWVRRTYGLSERQLDILFYVYPVNLFSATQFKDLVKEMGITDYTVFQTMKGEGWLSLWTQNGTRRYYVLSHKANELVKRVHRMFMLEEEIPMSARRNVVVRSTNKKDQKLVDLFKVFNNKVRE
jgi:DNA-binding MarR family transcriptional regulator